MRDFGILKGEAKKKLSPAFIPIDSFSFIAFYLSYRGATGRLLLHNPEWQLFFLSPDEIERLFMESHLQGLLEYHAAGSVIRISFPNKTLEEYANALTQRKNRSS